MGARRLGAVLLPARHQRQWIDREPRKARELWQLEFDGLRRVGGCWVLTNHPFLTGRPSRAAELDDLMRYVCEHDDVWVTNLGDIAEHVRTLGLTPRSITPPDVPR